jgi:hypothetical protein
MLPIAVYPLKLEGTTAEAVKFFVFPGPNPSQFLYNKVYLLVESLSPPL